MDTPDINRRKALGGMAAAGAAAITGQAQAAPVHLSHAPGFPNLILAEGLDPATEYRPALRSAIGSAPDFPVQTGTHDLVLSYPYPPQDHARPPSFGYGNHATPGRPFLGIGDLPRVEQHASEQTDQQYLNAVLKEAVHETLHPWLVPQDMLLIQRDGRRIQPTLYAAYLRDLELDRVSNPAPLLGRMNLHWNPYINLESPMDGVNWTRDGRDGEYFKWTKTASPGIRVAPEGLPAFDTNLRIGDLDLHFMGLKPASATYPSPDPEMRGHISLIEPRLTRGPQMRYQTGIFVSFARDKTIYFGFHKDHFELRIENNLGYYTNDDPPDWFRHRRLPYGFYEPNDYTYNAVMLRVVAIDNDYFFQACIGNGETRDGYSDLVEIPADGTMPHIFSQASTINLAVGLGLASGRNEDFANWMLVGQLEGPRGVRPVIGLFTKTWNENTQTDVPQLVEGRFFSFDLATYGPLVDYRGRMDRFLQPSRSWGVQTITRRMSPRYRYEDVPENEPVQDIPVPGAYIRPHDASILIGTPFGRHYDHWTHIDECPKILMRAPTEPYIFGTSVKVHRSIAAPAPGPRPVEIPEGTVVWGNETRVRVGDIVRPFRLQPLWRLPPRELRVAFAVPAADRMSVPASHFEAVDRIRRYYETALPVISQGMLTARTRL